MMAKLLWIEVGKKVYSQWPQLEFKRYLHFSASAMHSAHFIYLFSSAVVVYLLENKSIVYVYMSTEKYQTLSALRLLIWVSDVLIQGVVSPLFF